MGGVRKESCNFALSREWLAYKRFTESDFITVGRVLRALAIIQELDDLKAVSWI